MKSDSLLADHALASLHFLQSNELMFVYREDDVVHSKLVSIQDTRIAFDQHGGEDSGWLYEGVLRAGRNVRGDWVVYVAQPQIVEIVTDHNEKLFIPLPMSLFLGWDHRYYLWSLQGRKFEPSLPVFKAPYPNVYDNGRICWGSHRPAKVTPRISNPPGRYFLARSLTIISPAIKRKVMQRTPWTCCANCRCQKRKPFPQTSWCGRRVRWMLALKIYSSTEVNKVC